MRLEDSFFLPSYSLILPLENDMAIEGSSNGRFLFMFASLGKILITDNLRKRHVLVLDW